jgi:hypothetical protein
VPAAQAKGLADLAAIVTRAEGLLRAQATLKGDAHFAVERIHDDVAMALRMRGVDTALCDPLEGSVREVGDAVVRHEAAATGALSAGALLRDVMRRIEDLTVVASRTAVADAEPPVRYPATEAAATIEPAAPVIMSVALDEPAPGAAEVRREDVQQQAPSASAEADTADGAQAEPADTPVARSLDDVTVDEEQARSLREFVSNDESSEHAVAEPQAIAAPPAAAPTIAAANDDVIEPVEPQALTLSDHEAAGPAQTAIIAAAK